MPLARIITSMPDQAIALAERLQAHGYTVETIAPGETPVHPADLEVSVTGGRCAELIKQLVDQSGPEEPDVHIAAGTLRATPIVAAGLANSIHSLPPSVTDTMNGVAAGLQNKRDLLAKALREQRALLRQERIAERQHRRHREAPNEVVIGQVGRPGEPIFESVDADGSSWGDIAAGFEGVPKRNGEVVPECERGESVPTKELGAEAPVGTDPVVYQSVTPAQPFADTPAPIPANSSYESHRPLAANTNSTAAMQQSTGTHKESGRARRRAVRVVIPGGGRLSRRAREWRAAVLISCLFAGLLMLGWAAVTREPVSPLPKSFSMDNGVEQPMPFGTATAKPGLQSVTQRQPMAAQTHHVAAQPVGGVAPLATLPESRHSTAAASTRESQPTVRKQRRARSDSEDDIAEDEVIIHRLSPSAQTAETQKASLKKFSD